MINSLFRNTFSPLIWGITLLTVICISGTSAYAQETFLIEGKIINGTPSGIIPKDHVITLHLFTVENGLETIDAITDQEGGFRFTHIPFLESGRYLLSSKYDGIDYSIEFMEDDANQPIHLTVFDSSSDLSLITHRSHLWLLQSADPESGILSALEIALIENPHNKTFKPSLDQPSNMQFLRFSMPRDAHSLNVQSDLMGGEIIDVGTGFGMTAPITPGSHQIVFSYTFPYQGDQTKFSKGFLQDVEIFRLLVPSHIGNVIGSDMEIGDPTIIGEISYEVWETRDLHIGSELDIHLSQLPQLSAWDKFSYSITQGAGLTIGIPAVLGVSLVIILIYALLKHKTPTTHNPVPLEDEPAQSNQRQLEKE